MIHDLKRRNACKNRAVLGIFWWVLLPFWCWGSWKGTSSSWTMWSPSGITILNKCNFQAFLESHVNHKSNILWPIPPALYALGKFNWPYSLLFRHHSPRPFLSDPSQIIALPCHSVTPRFEFCSNRGICQSCYIDFAKMLHGFFKHKS